MEIADAATDSVARDLAREAEHGCIGRIRRAEGCGGVEHTWPRDDGIDRRSTRRPRVTEGHVACALLVARADEAHAVTAAVHRVEEMIELPAGQTENRIDFVPQ